MTNAALDKQLLDLLIAARGADPARVARVRELVAQGADLHAISAERTPLHWAARAGDVDCVKALLELGADPNRAEAKGLTALHEAVWVGAKDKTAVPCVQALLDARANATAVNAEGALPLHHAARNGLAGAIAVLAPRSPIDQLDLTGATALQVAIIQSEWPVVQRLLELGASVDDACVAKASGGPRRMRSLLLAAREGRQAPEGLFAKFAAALAQHVDEGPGANEKLTPDQVREHLERLAASLGLGVAQGLDANDDVDHFLEEYGDDWLEELLESYWRDAHSKTLAQAWETLPADTRAALPALEALSEGWRGVYLDTAKQEAEGEGEDEDE